ncbi:MAG: hypothetical protein ACYTG0_07200 [Planctomycetota bacterium]|jgi:hypothetical protein
MKKLAIAVSVAICLVVVAAASLSAQKAEPDAPADAPTSWQHLALSSDTEKGVSGDPELNRRIIQLGREGWELVDVENVTRDGTTTKTVYFFKRSQ